MNKIIIIKWVLLAIPLFFITKCGIEGVLYTANKTPVINPNPNVKLRIYGKFPFEKDVSLNISSHYILQNPKCQDGYYLYGLGWLMHDNLRETYTTVKATRTANGDYEAVLYMDYYETGFCDWKIEGFSVNMVQKGFMADRVGSIYASFVNKNVSNQDSTFNCGTVTKKDPDGKIFENTFCGRKGLLRDPSSEDYSRNGDGWIVNNHLDMHNSKKEIEINFIDKGKIKNIFDLEK